MELSKNTILLLHNFFLQKKFPFLLFFVLAKFSKLCLDKVSRQDQAWEFKDEGRVLVVLDWQQYFHSFRQNSVSDMRENVAAVFDAQFQHGRDSVDAQAPH